MCILRCWIVTASIIQTVNANAGNNQKLVFTARENIFSLSTEDNVTQTMVSGQQTVFSMDIDIRRKLLFWIEVKPNVIRKGSIEENGSVTGITDFVQYNADMVDTLAVDWLYGNLYWMQYSARHYRIWVTDFDGTKKKSLYYEQGATWNLVLDPRDGWLFYFRYGEYFLLERAGMDGDLSSRSIIERTDVPRGSSNALSVDYSARRLYWIDLAWKSVFSVDYDGLNKVSFPIERSHVMVAHNSVIVQNTIYWTESKNKSVRRINTDGRNFSIVVQDLPRIPYGIRAMDLRTQPNGVNFCIQENNTCSGLCLPRAYVAGDTRRSSCVTVPI